MQIREEYFRAGRIAVKVSNDARRMLKVGQSILEVCERIEEAIVKEGGAPAFPCNVSINHVAAHHTAGLSDKEVIAGGDVVKVDLGVHIGGYLVDTAFTISFDPHYEELVRTTEDALNNAIKAVKRDAKLGDIGRTISETARRRGYRPITNLSGHSIDPYQVHSGKSVPNIWVPTLGSFRLNEIYAIEPFLTVEDGSGMVTEGNNVSIFAVTSRKRTSKSRLDAFIDEVWNARKTLPFTPRWYLKKYSESELLQILAELKDRRLVRAYPDLVEAKGRVVAQFEHTVTPTEDGVVVLTQ